MSHVPSFRSWISSELIPGSLGLVLFSQALFLFLVGFLDRSWLIPGLLIAVFTDIILFLYLRKRAAVLAEKLEKPVTTMIEATRRMAERQQHQELPPATIEEFERLRTTFEQMSNQLENSYGNLERRVTVAVQSAVKVTRQQELLLSRQAKQAALGEMIGNIAHQWRQPLNSLGLIIQNFRDAFEGGEMDQAFLETWEKQGMNVIHSMSQMLDDFRTFFKTDDEEPRRFMVGERIKKTASFLEGTLQSNGINLEIDTRHDLELLGFPNAFSQVLLNLLNNANEALLEKAPRHPRIKIGLSEIDGKAVVTVEDNGGGIPPEVMSRLFEPYFTTRPPGKGTGLGLHLSRSILETGFKGQLTASNGEAGACLKIEVPLPATDAEMMS